MKKESLKKVHKIEQDAHKRIIKRGKIDFRVEPALLSQLLDLAKEHQAPVGKIVRDMVKAQLELGNKKPSSQLDKIERKIDKLLSMK